MRRISGKILGSRLLIYYKRLKGWMLGCEGSSLSILIPVKGNRSVLSSIKSVVSQGILGCEVLVLRNGIECLKETVLGKSAYFFEDSDVLIREIWIRESGKGNALNIGIEEAKHDLICVLDADCILGKNALSIGMRCFEDRSVSAVGGRLKAVNEKRSILAFFQRVEYMKNFNIWRVIFDYLKMNCLISGAYGIFRKCDIELVNGYDMDTVGEDMELVLEMQELLRGIGRKVLYEKDSICYTRTPSTMYRLFRQRDRWQRGLLDCLRKHERLMFNPEYGLLGCLALPYQFFVELLGPIFVILHFVNLIFAAVGFEAYFVALEMAKPLEIPQSWFLYFLYLVFEIVLTCCAEYVEHGKWYVFVTKMPEVVLATVVGSLLSVPLAFARLWGMISFHWRRLVW